MAKQVFSNNARATLQSAITAASTSIVLATGKGALFASPTAGDWQLATLTDGTNYEIVKITARSTDTLTVTRAQESTSARAWSANALIYAGVTMGTLDNFQQGTVTVPSDVAGLSSTGNARGTNAINLQTGRANVANVASGNTATVVGYNTKATGTGDTAIGAAAVAQNDHALAAGDSATASGTQSVAVGYSASSSAGGGVSIGANAVCDGDYSISVGNGAKDSASASIAAWQSSHSYSNSDIIEAGSPARVYICVKNGTSGGSAPSWGSAFVVDGGAIWRSLGQSETATSNISAGVGALSLAGNSATSIGAYSIAAANSAVSLGPFNHAARYGVAVGRSAFAWHENSMALGTGGESYTRHNYASVTSGVLPSLCHFPDWWFGNEYKALTGSEGVLMSEPVDLCGGSTWAATTAYAHGRVVKPVTPNGKQYVRYCNNYVLGVGPDAGNYSAGSSGGSEPTWPTTALNSVTDGDGDWICLDNSEIKIGTLPATFVVTRVGIIVYEYSSVSVQPAVSFGKATDHTLFVNNQTTTNLTAANKCQFWDITASEAVDNLTLTIDTLATGTKLLCRAVWHGYYVKHWL